LSDPLVIDLFWHDTRGDYLGLIFGVPENQERLADLLDKFILTSHRAIFLQKVEGRREVPLAYGDVNLLGLYCCPEAEHDARVKPEFRIAKDPEYDKEYARYIRRAILRHMESAALTGKPRAELDQIVVFMTEHLNVELEYLLNHRYIELRESESCRMDLLGITDAGSEYLGTL
jgi:hypothetical protein